MLLFLVLAVAAGAVVGAAVVRARLTGSPKAWILAVGATAAWIVLVIAATTGPVRVVAVVGFVLASWLAQRASASRLASSLFAWGAERREAIAARDDARAWERGFVSRAWMLDEQASYDFNPERDFRAFDRWVARQKRIHGPRHFADLRDRLKAAGEWQAEWSDRSV